MAAKKKNPFTKTKKKTGPMITSEFTQSLVSLVQKLKPGKYTGEDIRLLATKKGITAQHPNAWGAAMGVISRNYLKPTGKYVRPASTASHGRAIQVYAKR